MGHIEDAHGRFTVDMTPSFLIEVSRLPSDFTTNRLVQGYHQSSYLLIHMVIHSPILVNLTRRGSPRYSVKDGSKHDPSHDTSRRGCTGATILAGNIVDMPAHTDLASKRCQPCCGGLPTLKKEQVKDYLSRLELAWELVEQGRKIRREFKFSSFMEGMMFVNDVAAIAEDQGHHPDIYVFFKTVAIELTTHKLKGLSENDFILARKIEVCC